MHNRLARASRLRTECGSGIRPPCDSFKRRSRHPFEAAHVHTIGPRPAPTMRVMSGDGTVANSAQRWRAASDAPDCHAKCESEKAKQPHWKSIKTRPGTIAGPSLPPRVEECLATRRRSAIALARAAS